MPELPEVETIRRDLMQNILYKDIVRVEVVKPNLVKQPTQDFIDIITDNQFLEINRYGKLLTFSLMGDWHMLVHLKMTGQLMYQNKKGGLFVGGHSFSSDDLMLPGKYSYIMFHFNDDTTLYFNCMRQFGYMKVVDEDTKQTIVNDYGVEPLTDAFTRDVFNKLIGNKQTTIKQFLLNQKYIAGVGNIYVDESCFDAGIRPDRKISSLSEAERERLFKSIKRILKKAVEERGTTFNNYVDASGNQGNFVKFLKVYGRSGKPCVTCNTTLIKTKIAGRGTVYCPSCQI